MYSNNVEGAVFGSMEAAVLKRAYNKALSNLKFIFQVDEDDKITLARLILAIGHKRLRAFGELTGDHDVSSIATKGVEAMMKARPPVEVFGFLTMGVVQAAHHAGRPL